MLSEISQIEKDKYCILSLKCGTEKIKQRTITKQKQTRRYKLVVSRVEKDWGMGQNG